MLASTGTGCHLLNNTQNVGQLTEDSGEIQESETGADVQTESLAPSEAKITTFEDTIIALEDA